MNWRVVDSGIADAATNMAVDEAIMLAHAAGKVPPTLRLYGWRPAAVSLGYFQRAAEEIDLAACAAGGIAVVRRLTGGRAVLHDAELTYSIVIRENHPAVPGTVIDSYRYFSAGLLAGLTALGLEASLSVPRDDRGPGQRQPASAACFDAPAQYEITMAGRKLVGSAQVRKDGVILQHGSVLLRFRAADVAVLLRLPSAEARVRMTEMIARRAIAADEALGRPVAWREAADALLAAFGPALGIELEPSPLTAGEIAASRELAVSKYAADSWNRMR